MRSRTRQRWLVAAPLAATAAAVAVAVAPPFGGASSHREAPSISQDPTADNTDVYAFRSPDAPDTATIVANYIPFEEPAGGPNFYRFSDDVKYELKVDNTGDARPDVTYEFRFATKVRNGELVPLQRRPDHVRRQERLVHEPERRPDVHGPQDHDRLQGPHGPSSTVLGRNLLTPPNNVGPASTPNYTSLVAPAIHAFKDGTKVFAGQRDDPFFVDLGGTFDLLSFRSAPPGAFMTGGVDGLKGYSVNTIAIQVPIRQLTRTKSVPTDLNSTSSVVGVYATASRPVIDLKKGTARWQQVSRLANPLVNEVVIPLGKKDLWNRSAPADDKQFEKYYLKPELAAVVNLLYDIGAPTTNRIDLTTILLKGIPPKNPLGAPTTQIGNKPVTADLARVNLAAPPTPFASQTRGGLLDGQADGFPNGRRLVDDIVDIEERAVAGALAPVFGLPGPERLQRRPRRPAGRRRQRQRRPVPDVVPVRRDARVGLRLGPAPVAPGPHPPGRSSPGGWTRPPPPTGRTP